LSRLIIASILLLAALPASGHEVENWSQCPRYTLQEGPVLTESDRERRVRSTEGGWPCYDVLEKRFGMKKGRIELFSSPDRNSRTDSSLIGTTDGRSIKLDLKW
jgi:hypothetical protein